MNRSLIATIGFPLFSIALFAAPFQVQALESSQGETRDRYDAWLELPGGKLKFELVWDQQQPKSSGWIVNGAERIEVTCDVVGSEYVIEFPHYDSRITFISDEGQLIGKWVIQKSEDRRATFAFGAELRNEEAELPFQVTAKQAAPVVGRWRVKFSSEAEPAVGVFRFGPRLGLTGTFLTSTGDYRFLQGRFEGEDFTFSCFDGAHAFLFRFRTNDDRGLVGDFWSGDKWHETWQAERDSEVQLPDGFSIHEWNPNVKLDDLQYHRVGVGVQTLGLEEFTAPVRLIYIFGTWCPNCHDAGKFLKQLRDDYSDSGLKIQGLAFELTSDQQRNERQVQHYLRRFGHDFPVFLAGPADKQEAATRFPLLDRIHSYPTVIFLDANDQIRAVHAGFSGPATGETHEQLKRQFRSVIDEILASRDDNS